MVRDVHSDENVRIEALNRRIQAQTVENARLRQELTEALKKLEAVATLERNIAERRNGAERPGHACRPISPSTT